MRNANSHIKKGINMSAMNKLMDAVNKAKQGGGNKEYENDVFYYPARDPAGNGSAVFKFLPALNQLQDAPFVKTYAHGFKGPQGKWLIENCPTTIDGECPVCVANSELYAKLTKDEARKHGMNRKVSYIVRILIIEDKKTPDNEGKVFMYKCGQKVFDKILEAMSPVDEDDTKYNVFNIKDKEFKDCEWPDFKLKIRKVDGQTNYDKSTFEKPSVDTESSAYVNQCNAENDPQKFIASSQFKTPELLQKRLDLVLGNTVRMAEPKKNDDDVQEMVKKSKPSAKAESKRVEVKKDDDGDDDVMNLIKSLNKDDLDDDIPF